MKSTNHVTPEVLGGVALPALRIAIRPLTPDDHAYVRATWVENYKHSSAALLRMPWPMYKATVGVQLSALVNAAQLVGAFVDDGRLAGWLAYTPGRSVDTVHWVYTRHTLPARSAADVDIPCRRRGVMRSVIEHAGLSNRLAYTHRGARPVAHRGRKGRSPEADRHQARGPTSDVALAEWLRSQGRSVVFVPYEEWSR